MARSIYDILGINEESRRKEVYDAYIELIQSSSIDSKILSEAMKEIDHYRNFPNKEAYDKHLKEVFDKETEELISIVNTNQRMKQPMKLNKFKYKIKIVNAPKKSSPKWKKVLMVGGVLTVMTAGMFFTGCEKVNEKPITSASTTYTDEDISKEKEERQTIDYVVKSGDNSKEIIANNLGISVDDCEFLSKFEPKIDLVVKINVPKKVAEDYNYKNKEIAYQVCTYEVKQGEVNSLVDIANDVIDGDYWIFANCGKTPNELANEIGNDNPELYRNGIIYPGEYQICYHDTKENIDTLIKEGKIPSKEVTKG